VAVVAADASAIDGLSPSDRVAAELAATRGRITVLDALRGVAALGVVIFHVWGANDGVVRDDWFAEIAAWGWLGVPVFFVLSGYVIPLSTQATPSTPSAAARFFARRYVRVGVPLIAASVLSWLPWWFSFHFVSAFQGVAPPALSFGMVACHFTATCEFFGEKWLNGVFWTLSIELQFYLIWTCVIALRPYARARVAVLGIIAAIAVARYPSHVYFLHFTALFALGGWVWYVQSRELSRSIAAVGMLALSLCIAWTVGVPDALAGLATVLVIGYGKRAPRALVWLGAISYSVYLLHLLVALRVHNIGARFVDPQAMRHLIDWTAVVASVAVAWVFWRLVEVPALALSKRMRVS
jgi:peptidoglycan/LPS O-acetylase OafA/YrhL